MSDDFSRYSDEELAQLVERLAKGLMAAQGEQNERRYRRLAAAYGHELPMVNDVFAAVRRGPDGRDEIIWCFYCGQRAGWQIEHKIPIVRGGTNDPGNTVPSCATCNRAKSTMTMEEYRESIERRLGRAHVFSGEQAKK